MKKIVVVLDGLRFSESACRYAAELAQSQQAMLVGVFPEDFTYQSYNIYNLLMLEGDNFDTARKLLDEKDIQSRKAAVAAFETMARNHGLRFVTRIRKGLILEEILRESLYADLLLMDFTEKFSHHKDDIPARLLKDMLEQVPCPVLLVPPVYKEIEKVLILNDGRSAAVQALRDAKQFIPAYGKMPVEVLSVNNDNEDNPNQELLHEWLELTWPSSAYTNLQGDAEDEILNALKVETLNPVVVLGAYQRGTLSRWLKQSMADKLMQELNIPLFIAATR